MSVQSVNTANLLQTAAMVQDLTCLKKIALIAVHC